MSTQPKSRNPLAKPPKYYWPDRINDAVCNLLIGTPDSINAASGREVTYTGFYRRKHRRHPLGLEGSAIEAKRHYVAAHIFRMALCERLAKVVPIVVAVPTLVITAMALLKSHT